MEDETDEDLFPELEESEDEGIRKWLIEMVEELRKANSTNAEHNGMCSKAIAWLERQAQKPAEWSEEDEKFFKTALWHISYSISNGKRTDFHCDTTEWFKSLKERYTWKPSNLQMEALESATENCAYSEYQDCLKELIVELKKLKE